MKLSEAIRRGSRKRPQAFGEYFEECEIEGYQILCSCTLGAACEALLGTEEARKACIEDIEGTLREAFPCLSSTLEGERHDYCSWIIRLNDAKKMTREEIADLLEARGL
jgi:hypothetical protein